MKRSEWKQQLQENAMWQCNKINTTGLRREILSQCFPVRVQGSTSRPRCNPLGNRSWCIPESQRFEILDLWHLETCLIQWTKMLQIYKANWAQLTSFNIVSYVWSFDVQLRDVLWCLLCFLHRIGPRPAEAPGGAWRGAANEKVTTTRGISTPSKRSRWKDMVKMSRTVHSASRVDQHSREDRKPNPFLEKWQDQIGTWAITLTLRVRIDSPPPQVNWQTLQSVQSAHTWSPWGMQWKSLIHWLFSYIVFIR